MTYIFRNFIYNMQYTAGMIHADQHSWHGNSLRLYRVYHLSSRACRSAARRRPRVTVFLVSAQKEESGTMLTLHEENDQQECLVYFPFA